jgi:hypothetical protein
MHFEVEFILWQMKPTRDPPTICTLPEVAYEPYDDVIPRILATSVPAIPRSVTAQ